MKIVRRWPPLTTTMPSLNLLPNRLPTVPAARRRAGPARRESAGPPSRPSSSPRWQRPLEDRPARPDRDGVQPRRGGGGGVPVMPTFLRFVPILGGRRRSGGQDRGPTGGEDTHGTRVSGNRHRGVTHVQFGAGATARPCARATGQCVSSTPWRAEIRTGGHWRTGRAEGRRRVTLCRRIVESDADRPSAENLFRCYGLNLLVRCHAK